MTTPPPLPSRRPGRGVPVLALAIVLLGGCQPPPPAATTPPTTAAVATPTTADEFITRGIAKSEQEHDYAGAIAEFKRALALRPDDADTHYNLGLALGEQHDHAGALAEFDRVLTLNPRDAGACLARGNVRFAQEDYAGAVADFDRALALDPQLIDAYYARALAKRRMGNFDGAFADYDHALELDPNYWRAYNGRATTHNAHGDFALAIPDYEKRIALQPAESEYAWFQRTLLLRRLGRDGDEAALAREVASWPDNWPKTVGQFLLGHMGAEELLRLAAAPADAQTRREQLCEANYYVGITALLAGRTAEAREKFQATVDTGVSVFLEHLLARSELARMKN